jgi:hypothetical protein
LYTRLFTPNLISHGKYNTRVFACFRSFCPVVLHHSIDFYALVHFSFLVILLLLINYFLSIFSFMYLKLSFLYLKKFFLNVFWSLPNFYF